jgi:hypothetical protein
VDVSAVTASDAWAVGGFTDDSTESNQTLILHWDGVGWSAIPSPNPGVNGYLSGVTALSGTDAWAVGSFENSSGYDRTLILHWDGAGWARVVSPNPNPRHNYLIDVSAVSTRDVWAVGDMRLNGGDSLVLRWDGMRWSKVPSPNPSYRALLYGVSAASASDAWAVGGTCCNRTLILHWNGTQWSRDRSPSPGGGSDDHFLNSASAISAQEAWAVGHACKRIVGGVNDAMRCHTFTAHWDGTRWSRIRSPNPSSSDLGVNSGIANELNGVSAISTTDVWAVGEYTEDVSRATLTLILHWDGAAWSQA